MRIMGQVCGMAHLRCGELRAKALRRPDGSQLGVGTLRKRGILEQAEQGMEKDMREERRGLIQSATAVTC